MAERTVASSAQCLPLPDGLDDVAAFAGGVDVVIDYLWGKSAECFLIAAAKAGADAHPIRFVQVGSANGQDITLPSAVLRASAIELMGSGIGSLPLDRLLGAVGSLLQAAVLSGFKISATLVPLSDIGGMVQG